MDREKSGLRRLFEGTRGYLFVSAFTVCLYSVLQNYTTIQAGVMKVLGALEPLIWGMVIAFVVNMPMRFLENKVFRRWPQTNVKRCVCLALSFLFVLLVISVMMLMIVPKFLESAEIIVRNFDSYIVSLGTWGNQLRERFDLSASDIDWMESSLQSIFDYIDAWLGQIVPTVVKITVSVAAVAINGLLAAILSFYALFNKEKHMEQARRLVHALFGAEKRERILTLCSRTNRALNNYFFGMILECVILGSMCFIGMTIFRFPYALLISVIVGLMQIVPVIGPWFSAILGAVIILMTDPVLALWFLIFVVIVQQLEGNLVYPRVVGNMVGLSGIWVLIAVLLGAGLFGVAGVVLCVPVMAVIQTLVREWVDMRIAQKMERQPASVEAVPLPEPAEPPAKKKKQAPWKKKK